MPLGILCVPSNGLLNGANFDGLALALPQPCCRLQVKSLVHASDEMKKRAKSQIHDSFSTLHPLPKRWKRRPWIWPCLAKMHLNNVDRSWRNMSAKIEKKVHKKLFFLFLLLASKLHVRGRGHATSLQVLMDPFSMRSWDQSPKLSPAQPVSHRQIFWMATKKEKTRAKEWKKRRKRLSFIEKNHLGPKAGSSCLSREIGPHENPHSLLCSVPGTWNSAQAKPRLSVCSLELMSSNETLVSLLLCQQPLRGGRKRLMAFGKGQPLAKDWSFDIFFIHLLFWY